MKNLFFLIFLSFMGLNAVAQSSVVPIQSISNVNGGIVYALPKTALEINVEITKTYNIQGPYAKYAKKYFELKDSEIITSSNDFFEISKINIQAKGIADPDKTYFVKAKAASGANLIQTNENGIIVGVNIPMDKQHHNKMCNQNNTEKGKLDFNFDKSDLSENYFLADSSEKAADIVASQIYTIREATMDLLTGKADYAPADGASIQIMLTELKKKEATLMQLFTGKRIETTETKTIELSPKENSNKDILFYFSVQKGISNKEDVSAKPVYISLNANKKEYFQLEKKSLLKASKQGLVYCLPGSADIEISDANKSYYKGNASIAQFGTTVSLPAKLLDKNKHVIIIFDSATGAIKSIND